MSHFPVTGTPHSFTPHQNKPHLHPRSSSGSSRHGSQSIFQDPSHHVTLHPRPSYSSGPSIQESQPLFRGVSQTPSVRSGFGYETNQWNLPPSNPGVVLNQGYSSRETSRPRSRRKFNKYRDISSVDRCLYSRFSDRLQRRISVRFSKPK